MNNPLRLGRLSIRRSSLQSSAERLSTINHRPSSSPYSFNSHASTLPLPLTSMAPRGSKTNSSFSFS
jgi:hypothetical protein